MGFFYNKMLRESSAIQDPDDVHGISFPLSHFHQGTCNNADHII